MLRALLFFTLFWGHFLKAESISRLCSDQLVSRGDVHSFMEQFYERVLSESPWLAPFVIEFLSPETSLDGRPLDLPGARERLWAHALQNVIRNEGDRQLARSWLQERLERDGKAQLNRESVAKQTGTLSVRVSTVRFIKPHFKAQKTPWRKLFQYARSRPAVRFPYSFEVMDTPVTQEMWVRMMGENTSFKDHHPSIRARAERRLISGREAYLVPDMPVTNLTVFSMAEFANRLSAAYGLRPAYVIKGRTGRAEDGTLSGTELRLADKRFERLNGFRFPSLLESAFLTDPISRDLDEFSDEQDLTKRILEKAWMQQNALGVLQMVADRQPVRFSEGPIFDLLGLVEEPVHAVPWFDWAREIRHEATGRTVEMLYVRGGHFSSLATFLVGGGQIYGRIDGLLDARAIHWRPRHSTGFRLVRTVR